jgi:SAM-dependent methyltransferase
VKLSIQNFSVKKVVSICGLPSLLSMRRAARTGWDALISPYITTRVIQTLFHVGFLDALQTQGCVDPLNFASDHNLDGPILAAMCDALFARGYLWKNGARYAVDTKGRFLLETDLIRGWFELAYGYGNVLHQMEALLRRDVSYGPDVVRDGRFVAIGSGLACIGFYFPLVADAIRQAGYRRVLDVGCGDGTFLRFLCERLPVAQGVGVDLSPDAVAAGNEQLKACGLEARIRLHTGNALELGKLKEQLQGVDAATTFFVLHELCDRRENQLAVEFLCEFRRALRGVPFHIVETIRPAPEELRRRPGMAIEYFLLHDLSLQKPIGREEWRKVFERAGFESLQEQYISFARTAIFKVQ